MALKLLVVFISMVSLLSTTVQKLPSFGKNILVLDSQNQIIRQPQLSSDGNWLFSNVDNINFQQDGKVILLTFVASHQAIWKLQIPSTIAAPMLINSSDFTWGNDFQIGGRFAPDSRYLAVKTDTKLQLRTPPDFAIESKISAVYSDQFGNENSVTWSADSHLLTTLVDKGVLVWDITQNKEYQYSPPYEQFTIDSIKDGWLLKQVNNWEGQKTISTSFTICDLHLERCNTYEQNTNASWWIIVSPDAQNILSVYQESVGNAASIRNHVTVWQAEKGLYKVTGVYSFNPQTDAKFCPQYFSPDSQFIYSQCGREASIWSFNPLIKASQTFSGLKGIWLPNSEYFVVFNDTPSITLSLFKIGTDIPIDVLEFQNMAGFEKIKDWLYEDTLFEHMTISNTSQKLLLNLGRRVLIIPIEYK